MIVQFSKLKGKEITAIKAAMEKEQSVYYGTDYGYTEVYPEPLFPLGGNEESPCGYFSEKNFFGWLRTSGAWLTVSPSTGEATFSGRRHSLLTLERLFPEIKCLRDKPYEYIKTRRTDLPPFETTTDPQ